MNKTAAAVTYSDKNTYCECEQGHIDNWKHNQNSQNIYNIE